MFHRAMKKKKRLFFFEQVFSFRLPARLSWISSQYQDKSQHCCIIHYVAMCCNSWYIAAFVFGFSWESRCVTRKEKQITPLRKSPWLKVVLYDVWEIYVGGQVLLFIRGEDKFCICKISWNVWFENYVQLLTVQQQYTGDPLVSMFYAFLSKTRIKKEIYNRK